jgi:DNA polymerase II
VTTSANTGAEPQLGYVLQPTYRVRSGRPVVQLFGRLQGGPPFLIEDARTRPYFFVRASDASRLGPALGETEPTDLTDFAGAPVVRVTVSVPGEVPPLRDRLLRVGVDSLEADIRFPYRYLIDRDIRAGVAITGPSEMRGDLRVFRDPDVRPAAVSPELSTLSIDIETTPRADRVFAVALVGCGVEEVHLLTAETLPGAVSHADESTLLEAVVERIRALDPDVLLGWNVVDFDLRVLAARARSLGVPFRIGRVDEDVGFARDQTFTRQSRAEIPGRMVLDGAGLVRDALRLEDYRLDTVARAVLGRGKKIDAEAPDAAREIQRLYREDLPALVAYNLEDARLVAEILEHEGLLALTIERSLLSGMPLDRVGASIASLDRLYLPELRRAGAVAPSVEADRKSAAVAGGAVLDSIPGLFRNVAVLDFKSLYPSLMRTFQLDPWAHACATREGLEAEGAIVAPNGARFAREGAILPRLIEDFMASRERAKQRRDRHADQAIKIMMNAFFGVLGASACRFFDPDVANAITHFGQQTLSWTKELLEAEGVRVLYGDTDSVFAEIGGGGTGAVVTARAAELRDRIEAGIAARIRERYAVEPKLVLELEHVLDRFFMPRVRGGQGGSKKRYAGWLDGRLRIVGLEAVRRDWPALARRLQTGLLEHLFTDRDPVPFVADLTARLRAGELDGELIYVKRVRKGATERYVATTPPHVQAARKAGGTTGGVIRYVMTREGPEPALPGRPLPTGIDREHYVEKVVRPISDAILTEVKSSLAEVLGEPMQLSLL